MKKFITISGILFLLLIAGTSCQRFHRGEMRERIAMHRNFRMHRKMSGHSGQFEGRHFGMMGQRPFERQGMGFGMRYWMQGMQGDSLGLLQFGAGKRMLESIPNVTEDQKKQIQELFKNQQEDMKKIRDEMAAKMKTLISERKKSLENILTAEQKKYIEDVKSEKVR